MVTNFKIFEKNKDKYAFIVDLPGFEDAYGIIKNKIVHENTYYLIEFLCELTPDMWIIIENTNSDLPTFLKKASNNQCWFIDDYVITYDSKEEFDENVEDIQIKKRIKKYNI